MREFNWSPSARKVSRTNTRAWVSCEITTLCVFLPFRWFFWNFNVKWQQGTCYNVHMRLILARKMLWLMQCCVRYALLKIIVKIDRLCRDKFYVFVKIKKFGTLHEFACHPCAADRLMLSVEWANRSLSLCQLLPRFDQWEPFVVPRFILCLF